MTPLVSVHRAGDLVVLTVRISQEQAEAAQGILQIAPFAWIREAGEAIACALGSGQDRRGEDRIASR